MDAQLVADIPTLATERVPVDPTKVLEKGTLRGFPLSQQLDPKSGFCRVQDRFTAWYSWLGRSGALVPHKGALRSGCAVSRD